MLYDATDLGDVGADDGSAAIAAERRAEAEAVTGAAVRGDELLVLGPGAPTAGEDVRRALLHVAADLVIAGADEGDVAVAAQGHGNADGLHGIADGGRERLLLGPGTPT